MANMKNTSPSLSTNQMTPGTQVKLLRVLQERCVQRLGGRETIPVDVRVLTATHHDLGLVVLSFVIASFASFAAVMPIRDQPNERCISDSAFVENAGPSMQQ